MRGTLQRKLNNESGFTLAETLVALAISTILLAITMVGIIQYSKNMKLTEMDAAAKDIFIAAQNHLTQADASGELKRYREKALDKTDTTVTEENLGTLMKDKPSDVPTTISWPSPNKEYYYIEYNTKTPTSVANLEGSILKYMLPFGAIDETVRADGRYIIEYNVETATVYGVFYAEEDVNFGPADITWLNLNKGRDDTSEGRHVRRDYTEGIIGYYGGAMAGNLPAAKTDDLELEIKNEDTLEISVVDPNYFNKATDGTTLVQSHLTLTVKGKDSGNVETFTLSLNDSTSAPTKKDAKKDLWWSVKNVELIEETSKEKKTGLEYTITLDDITRPGGHFADICKTLMPGEDIIVKVTSASSTALATVREAEGLTNSLFEAVTKSSDPKVKESTASIGYLRHLENLDNGVSSVPINRNIVTVNGKAAYTPEYLVTKAVQTKDMDWNKFFGADKENRKSVYEKGQKETVSSGVKLANGSFYGIKRDLLKEYDGQNHKISNVYINNENKDSNVDSSSEGKVNGALIRYSKSNLAITNLVLEDFDVTADRNAAALIGEMQQPTGSNVTGLQISNVLVVGGRITSTFTRGNSGGLIGYTGARTIVNNCTSNTKIIAKGARFNADYAGDAGGLIGEIKSDGRDIAISNCYSGGQTENGEYSKREDDYNIYGIDTAGGLIGKINGGSNTLITNCYSTCSAYVANDNSNTITGSAGGLVGKQKSGSATYKNCYATGLVNGDTGAYVGAFIGISQSGDSFTNCYFLKGINEEDQASATVSLNGKGTIKAVSFSDMQNATGDVITHPMDATLDGKSYPFETVNKVGLLASENQTVKGVHYGDWQEPEEEVVQGSRAFAYREQLGTDEHWYVVFADSDENGKVTTRVTNTLLKEEGKHIYDTEASYGILIPADQDKDKIEKHFQGNPKNYVVEKPETVTIDETKYYYYQIDNSKDAVKNARDRETGVVKFLPWKGSGKEGNVTFYFNPDFAAAISANDETALGDEIPYQVRTNQQLRNIASDAYQGKYRTCNYEQTLDIILSDVEFKAFGGKAFTGTYDAFYKDGKGYEINGFKQSINTKGEAAGLITEIGSDGEVSYVTLHGTIDVTQSGCKDIGSLSGVLRGKVMNCYSDVSINVRISVSYIGNIGGLLGTVHPGAEVSACHYKTVEVTTMAVPFNIANSVPKTLNVGGLVGYNSGTITKSSADTKITHQQTAQISPPQIGVGGLVGKICNGGKVAESWAKLSLSGTGIPGSYFGGFVGIISGESTISDCYSALETHSFTPGWGTRNLFAGNYEMSAGKRGTLRRCHALELDYYGNVMKSSYKFGDGQALIDSQYCYRCGFSAMGQDVEYIDLNEYTDLGKFAGFDDDVWEVKRNGKYPTLINNPESSTLRQKSLSRLSVKSLDLPMIIE